MRRSGGCDMKRSGGCDMRRSEGCDMRRSGGCDMRRSGGCDKRSSKLKTDFLAYLQIYLDRGGHVGALTLKSN